MFPRSDRRRDSPVQTPSSQPTPCQFAVSSGFGLIDGAGPTHRQSLEPCVSSTNDFNGHSMEVSLNQKKCLPALLQPLAVKGCEKYLRNAIILCWQPKPQAHPDQREWLHRYACSDFPSSKASHAKSATGIGTEMCRPVTTTISSKPVRGRKLVASSFGFVVLFVHQLFTDVWIEVGA